MDISQNSVKPNKRNLGESLNIEQRRKLNKQRNLDVLRGLGLIKEHEEDDKACPKPEKNAYKQTKKKNIFDLEQNKSQEIEHNIQEAEKHKRVSVGPLRRSSRINSINNCVTPNDTDVSDMSPSIERSNPYHMSEVTNKFGDIGIPVGTVFSSRPEACQAGLHRSYVAGIHSNKDGCYSICLNGGYEDDVDNGFSFVYTGSGGRDLSGTKVNPKNLRTAKQSKDQMLAGHNLNLIKNIENNLPVRVLRGYKLKSPFAPTKGFRYDGLYKVVNYFSEVGRSGFRVYKYSFERLPDQDPAPWC